MYVFADVAHDRVKAALAGCERRGLARQVRINVRPLSAPVHFDKFVGDTTTSMKSIFGFGSQGIETNTNEDINWTDNEWKAARKARKDAKNREKQQKEIEDRMSGRSNASTFIKVHPSGDRFPEIFLKPTTHTHTQKKKLTHVLTVLLANPILCCTTLMFPSVIGR